MKKDLKWIGGLFAAVLVGATLFVWGLARITAPQVAIEAMTTATALIFSPRGLDDATDIRELQRMVAESPDGVIRPVEGLDIEVRATDLEGKTPRQVRLDLFRQAVEPIYQGQESQPAGVDQLGVLALFSARVHARLVTWTFILAGLSLLPLALMVWMSQRFGRLVSPGVVLVLLTLLPTALLLAVSASFVERAVPGEVQQGSSELIGYISGYIGPTLVRAFGFPYRWGLLVGALLLLAALVGRIVYGFTHKKGKKDEPKKTAKA